MPPLKIFLDLSPIGGIEEGYSLKTSQTDQPDQEKTIPLTLNNLRGSFREEMEERGN
jgi:hypothetical protein